MLPIIIIKALVLKILDVVVVVIVVFILDLEWSCSSEHFWDQLFTADTIRNIGETGDIYWLKSKARRPYLLTHLHYRHLYAMSSWKLITRIIPLIVLCLSSLAGIRTRVSPTTATLIMIVKWKESDKDFKFLLHCLLNTKNKLLNESYKITILKHKKWTDVISTPC